MRVHVNLAKRCHLVCFTAPAEERRSSLLLEKQEQNAQIQFQYAQVNVRNFCHVEDINANRYATMMNVESVRSW